MLIPFPNLIRKYNIKPEGVCHFGASVGQEAEWYYSNGVKRTVWVEAIPDVFKKLVSNLEKYPDAIAINACLNDIDGEEVDFGVSSNDGESSSFLPLGTHKIVHPEVSYVDHIEMTTKRIDTIFTEQNIDINDYPFINLDLQGTELRALKGMGNLLNDVKFAYLEINKDHLYVGCPLIEEIDEYMSSFDFVRVETEWAGNTGWGDCFMIKKNLL